MKWSHFRGILSSVLSYLVYSVTAVCIFHTRAVFFLFAINCTGLNHRSFKRDLLFRFRGFWGNLMFLPRFCISMQSGITSWKEQTQWRKSNKLQVSHARFSYMVNRIYFVRKSSWITWNKRFIMSQTGKRIKTIVEQKGMGSLRARVNGRLIEWSATHFASDQKWSATI